MMRMPQGAAKPSQPCIAMHSPSETDVTDLFKNSLPSNPLPSPPPYFKNCGPVH